MRIVKDKAKSPAKPKSVVFTEEFWRNWRLEFIAAHNEKIEKQKRRLLPVDAPRIKSC